MRHPAKFREDQSNRSGDIADFRFSRWRPSAILDFPKFKILTYVPVRKPSMRHHTKFRKDRSNRSGDIADLRFFGEMAKKVQLAVSTNRKLTMRFLTSHR